MEWPTLESYFLMRLPSGYFSQDSFNINFICLYIISMYQMEQRLLFYIILMTVSIGMLLKLLGKKLDALVNISHLNFLGNAHWFISIRISCMKDHSISVDQTRYATSIVDYLDVSVVKISKTLYRTTLPYDIIFTKSDASTSDEQVGKLTT